MKNNYIFLLPLLMLFSCQTEEYEVSTEEDKRSITKDMEAYALLYRAAMYDGSADDDIDNSPCLSVTFPYALTFQGQEISITSEERRNIFLEGLPAGERPDISFNFPITVVNASHQRIEVRNRQQLAALQKACENMMDQDRGPITCIQFIFPVQVNSYDREFQQTGSAMLNSQQELFTYLENLTAASVINFSYPLEAIQNHRLVSLSDRTSLVAALKQCED